LVSAWNNYGIFGADCEELLYIMFKAR